MNSKEIENRIEEANEKSFCQVLRIELEDRIVEDAFNGGRLLRIVWHQEFSKGLMEQVKPFIRSKLNEYEF